MPLDKKLIDAIGRHLQGYEATPPRIAQITTEVVRMQALMTRHAQRLTFEDEPATFVATRRRAAKNPS